MVGQARGLGLRGAALHGGHRVIVGAPEYSRAPSALQVSVAQARPSLLWCLVSLPTPEIWGSLSKGQWVSPQAWEQPRPRLLVRGGQGAQTLA